MKSLIKALLLCVCFISANATIHAIEVAATIKDKIKQSQILSDSLLSYANIIHTNSLKSLLNDYSHLELSDLSLYEQTVVTIVLQVF